MVDSVSISTFFGMSESHLLKFIVFYNSHFLLEQFGTLQNLKSVPFFQNDQSKKFLKSNSLSILLGGTIKLMR